MQPTVEQPQRTRTPTIKSVVLPAEHGGWSLVLEPVILGLLVAPSTAGFFLGVAALALFLSRRPLSTWRADTQHNRVYPRTIIARRYGLGLVAVAAAAVAVVGVLAGPAPFIPALIAVPFFIVFLVYEQRPGRSWQAELAAPVAISAVAASIAVAGQWGLLPAMLLWLIVVLRAVPTILYIRARLRLDKDRPIRRGGVIAVHLAAVAIAAVLVWMGQIPAAVVVALLILLARTVWGLSNYRWRSSVKAFGFTEVGFGLLTVLIIAAGYRL